MMSVSITSALLRSLPAKMAQVSILLSVFTLAMLIKACTISTGQYIVLNWPLELRFLMFKGPESFYELIGEGDTV